MMKQALLTLKKKINAAPFYAGILLHYLILPSFVSTAVNSYYFLCNDYDGARHLGALLLSYLFVILLNAFLLTLFKKEKISLLILALFSFILAFASQIKMVISGMNPVFLSDLFFASDAGAISIMVKYSDLPGILLRYLPETLFFLAFLTILIIIAFFLDYRVKKKRVGWIACAATALALLFTFLPIRPLHTFAYSLFFREDTAHDPVDYYSENGFFSGILGQYWHSHPPIENTSAEADAILSSLPEQPIGSWGTPNIVMIFSESFFDLAKLDDVTFSQSPTAHYTALKEEGISFSMLSPVKGGLSCNAEFQILTGGNMSYYPLGYVPYTMLYDQDSRYPSIIEELSRGGYYTEIVSTWQKNLCSCDTVYATMPLDSFRYDYGEEIKGLYYSEKTVGDMLKKTLAEKGDQPLFLMTQTAQAHMPYYLDKYDHYDLDILSSPLTEKETGILRSYAQGIYDADKMLYDIYQYIQTLQEPTVLIFYGDHLPTLSDAGDELYDKFSYFNTDDALLNEARRYTTEGLILANFDLTDDIDYLGQDLLMPYVASHLSIELSPFYRYLVGTIDTLPALGVFAAYDANGNLYAVDALPEKMKTVYDERKLVQNARFWQK